MAKMTINLNNAYSMVNRINEFLLKVYLTEETRERENAKIEKYKKALATEKTLEGTLGHDDRVKALEEALEEARNNRALAMKDDELKFKKSAEEKTLCKEWLATARGSEGHADRVKALRKFLEAYDVNVKAIRPEVLDEVVWVLTGVKSVKTEKAIITTEWFRNAGLNIKNLYYILLESAWVQGYVTEDIPPYLYEVYAERKAEAEAKRRTKKARKARKEASK